MAKAKKTANVKGPESTAGSGKPAPPTETRWKPGQSGNPGGQPKGLADVRKAARGYTQECIDTLAKWLRDDNPKASIPAAIALLNRGWGMPQQNIKTTVQDVRGMTDAELYEYLLGDSAEQGGGGEGAAEAQGDPGKLN